MPRKKTRFSCPQCGQSFSMKMHLGRHLSAKHGKRPKTAGRAKTIGRPSGVAGRLGLHNLSLEQLIEVIAAAKLEVGRRIAEFQAIMR